MLGPEGALPYSNSPPDRKPGTMSVQTMNPFQEQGGQSFGPSAGIPPKTGVRRQGGLWATGAGGHSSRSNFAGPRNGEAEMDTRLHAAEYPSAVLDQGSLTGQDPFRSAGGGGGLARYHSAPSSFLAGLAADFQQDSALSSFFADADLPSLNPASDSSMDTMDAEQSTSNIFDDKFLLDIRKFERIGNSQLGQSVNSSSGGAGLVSQKALQSGYKPSMEVLHENSSVNAQMASSPQMSSGLSSAGLCMPSTMGLVQQATAAQQMNLGGHLSAGSPQGAQQQAQAMSYGNLGGSGAQGGVPQVNIGSPLSGNMNFSGGLSSDFGGGTLQSPGGRSNNLLRQTSSPAGLLAQLSIEAKTPSPSQLPKTEKQSLSSPLANSPDDSQSGGTSEDTSGTHGMMSGLDVSGWEDAATSYMKSWGNDTFSARKRFRDNMDLGEIMVSAESPGATLPSMEHGPLPGSLTRHMSLPSSKSKIGIPPDDLLQSVPCRIRAKRGCATHPRSIAERVRRTRISERMRKLQELVPNMDKQQTNTADMLDEAVEYVKQLQRQVQELTESQAKCNGTCHQDRKNAAS